MRTRKLVEVCFDVVKASPFLRQEYGNYQGIAKVDIDRQGSDEQGTCYSLRNGWMLDSGDEKDLRSEADGLQIVTISILLPRASNATLA
ncbi:MAG: hypothetical protein ACUVX8_07020 [Candidatus Zipacnadales bacterium]